MFMWTFVHDYSLVCVHIYKALVSAHRRQSWTLQPIAHSTAEYEWTVGVLHRSSQPRGQVGADIQATLSQGISLILGLSSSQRKGLLFTYMYSFKWFEFCARHSLAVCKYYGTQLWLRFILQVMRTLMFAGSVGEASVGSQSSSDTRGHTQGRSPMFAGSVSESWPTNYILVTGELLQPPHASALRGASEEVCDLLQSPRVWGETPQVVQGPRHQFRDPCSIPDWGTSSHMLQLRHSTAE